MVKTKNVRQLCEIIVADAIIVFMKATCKLQLNFASSSPCNYLNKSVEENLTCTTLYAGN